MPMRAAAIQNALEACKRLERLVCRPIFLQSTLRIMPFLPDPLVRFELLVPLLVWEQIYTAT